MAAYVHCNFHSCILRMQVDVSILLPEKERMEDVEQGKKGETFGKNKKYQTLYLLHGFTGDHLSYLRTSKIERYADEHQIMVVMPSVYNSAYTDMKYGLDYFSYLTEELTDFVERNFPAATKRENRFIAGMSMGGFGTLKIALRYPERFLAACPIASAVQLTNQYVHHRTDEREWFGREFEKIFGHYEHPEELLGSEEDCYWLLDQALEQKKILPAFMMAQGTEDFTYNGNKEFYQYATAKGVPVKWVEAPGVHDWNSWNLYIPQVFSFIKEQMDR